MILIEIFDLLCAIDSILSGVAFIGFAKGAFLFSKIWIVYLGGVIGILATRYAAHWFSSLIHRFPKIERQAHLIIGWVGLKLGFEIFFHSEIVVISIFWAIPILLFGLGFVKDRKQYG